MVDVTEKKETARTAVARSRVQMHREVYRRIEEGTVGKGDVLAVAQVAGVMAAKNTSNMIPMCHPLPLTGVNIHYSSELNGEEASLNIEVEVKTTAKTGVEMEALTAASSVALTVYDMCKSMDKSMVIGPTCVVRKTGGKSGAFRRED